MNNGGPAFPAFKEFKKYDDFNGEYIEYHLPANGMSLRDYFAAHATDFDVQNYRDEEITDANGMIIQIRQRTRAEAKYAYADDMLKAGGHIK